MATTLTSVVLEPATYYERLARTTWGQYLTRVENDALATALSLVGRPGRVLEMGCEAGRRCVLLASQGWNVSYVDINEDALRICQERIPEATCILAKPEDRKIQAADHIFKLLLCIEVDGVLMSDWFLPEAHRVLADGGCLVSTMTNRASYRTLAHGVLKQFRPRMQYESYRKSFTQWTQDLGRNGFTVSKATGFCWFPFHRGSDSAVVPLAAKVEKIVGLRKIPQFSPWVVSVAQNRL